MNKKSLTIALVTFVFVVDINAQSFQKTYLGTGSPINPKEIRSNNLSALSNIKLPENQHVKIHLKLGNQKPSDWVADVI
jgi:hypothetical protein